MAFQLHLIEPLRDLIPAVVPACRRTTARLSVQWELDGEGHPRARWIQD
jgi:hypothetical protein